MENLRVTCPTILDGGEFSLEHTGKGDNISPEFLLKNLTPQAKSLAIILEDLDHPLKKNFTHWLIWNLPASSRIPAKIPHGFAPETPQGARQGIAYGWHGYAGPKPPLGQTHDYRFTVYALDESLSLSRWTRKGQLLKAMGGHILQKGQLTASFGSPKDFTPLPIA
ncbi:YbhB/YbcL family Raf kinase inhibitor-like protein [Streptococcus downei]|uniref:Phosphatidylethanolamine-binding protein n=1 Tax=Streptococcus downei MFe28 TaxID=764290 RepID=A0A380JG90_STRDO|nr:YbhB/YbcL family Raf kinase inhibitor-like protein [Streptococcus downei]EFQ56493.1 Raf-like protein [Streptococcus downei F0415]SUN37419.1 phosphatidylethanolamine-binding protein [Streptococcus downei MFe28]